MVNIVFGLAIAYSFILSILTYFGAFTKDTVIKNCACLILSCISMLSTVVAYNVADFERDMMLIAFVCSFLAVIVGVIGFSYLVRNFGDTIKVSFKHGEWYVTTDSIGSAQDCHLVNGDGLMILVPEFNNDPEYYDFYAYVKKDSRANNLYKVVDYWFKPVVKNFCVSYFKFIAVVEVLLIPLFFAIYFYTNVELYESLAVISMGAAIFSCAVSGMYGLSHTRKSRSPAAKLLRLLFTLFLIIYLTVQIGTLAVLII